MSSLASMQATIRRLFHAIAVVQPPIDPQLRPASTEEEIRSAETMLGLQIPSDLQHFLLCHNGQLFFDDARGYGDPLIPMMRQAESGVGNSHQWLSGVKEIIDATRCYREELPHFRDVRFEKFGPTRNHDHFLVISGTENADCLALDLLPEPGGTVGQVVLFCTQAPCLTVLAPSLESYLQSLADGFETGRFQHHPCEYFVSYVERR